MFLNRLTFCITFGSILGSILESFWGPSSSLYSFLGAGVHKKGLQKEGSKNSSKKVMRVMVRWSKVVRAGEGPGGGDPYKDPAFRPPERENLIDTPLRALRARWRIYIFFFVFVVVFPNSSIFNGF